MDLRLAARANRARLLCARFARASNSAEKGVGM